MALFRKFFYRKPPDGLLEISERVYVFDCCFTTEVLEEEEYKVYIAGIVGQLRESLTDASFMVFNFREGESQSLVTNILSEYDMTVIDYPRHYEGCPLLTMEMIHHFLRSSESWLSLGQQNVLLMHCERGGWPVLAFMLAGLLIYRKQYAGEQKILDMIYKQAPQELLQLMSPLNPLPSQLRYLQYVSRRNVASEWPPLDRALTLDCVIIRCIPNMDGEGGCRPIFRIYGQDPFMATDRTSKVLFSTPKKSKLVRQYKQVDCELVKIDIHCHIQGDVVLECISLDNDLEREEMMFRVMFNTAFIRSNILMLNPDDIDILWHAKDQFPKDFRAEVLFSEMEATTSLISVELPNIEEKDGLPIEAFARVQEIFSNVDWLSPKGDAALNVLQKITASNLLQEKLVSSGSLERNQLLDLSFEKLISESETSEDNIRSLRWKLQTNQPLPSSEPPQSKIITQLIPQPSLSTPVSFRSSVQGSPPPLLRYHSAPSALGITALLHDHSEFSSKEVIHPATISSPSSALLTTSVLDSRKDIQPGKLPILPLLLPLEPSATLENSPTTTSTSTIPDPLSLHQLSLKPIKSSISQPSQTTSRGRSQLSPSSLQPTCTSFPVEPSPSFNESLPSISSSSPLLRPSPSFSSKESFFVPTSPPLRARFSRLESPSFSRWTNGSISPSTPQPSSTTLLLSSTKTSGSISPSPPQPSSTTLLLSSTKTSTQSFSSDDRLVSSKSPKKNLTIVPPQSFSSDDRLVSSKSSKKHKSSKKNLTIVPPQSFSSDDRLVSSKSPKKNLTIVPPQSFYSDDRLVYSKSSKKNLTIVPPQSFSSDDRLVSSKSPKKNLTIVPPQSFSSEDRLVSSKSYKKNLTIIPPQSFSQSFSSDDRLVSSKSSKKNLTIVPPQSFSSDDRLVSSKSPKKNLSIVPPQSFSSDDRLVSSKSPKKNLTIVPPPPPCSSPNLGASVVSPTLASPPPPPPPSWKDSTITTMHDPPPPPPPPAPPLPPSNLSSPSTSGSSVTSLGPPPPPPPPPSPPPLGLAPHDSATIVRNLTVVPGPPPPPPPPSLSSSLGPSIVSLVPPPPPPPPSLAANVSATTMHVSGPPPPPPPPFANSGSTLCRGDVTSAPPAPPPPGFSMNGSTTHAPPAPPPPGLSGNKLSNVNGTNSQSHVGINNSNIPSIPGPPSSALFAKGRGLGRLNPKSMSQPKRSNLKPYHWLKLTRAMQGSLWAETQKTDEASKAPEFDMSELESLFSAATPNSDSGGSGNARRASGPKSDKVQLIELRRAYNCEIMLSKVKIPLPDMMCSVLALDDSALDVDQVENLIKFCPTKEEIELLKGYSGDKDNLGKCEQFFLELLKVPRVESKLRVFSFKIQFRSQASDLRNSLNTINSASDEIRNSTKLKRVMQTILSLGNALNHGTARGSAIGFRLDSLLKLTDTRARNNKMTLMHYLCKVLGEKLPELLDFPKDLLSLEGSTKIQLKYLAEEMQAISKGLEKVVQELANSENDGPVSECFCRTLKDFLSHAEAEVRSLASLYSNVGRNADALALYFGEDPARCPFEQVVSTLFNFVRMFVRAHEENCKQLEYERKKALKEAAEKEKEKQKERLKVSTPEKESGFFMRTKT